MKIDDTRYEIGDIVSFTRYAMETTRHTLPPGHTMDSSYTVTMVKDLQQTDVQKMGCSQIVVLLGAGMYRNNLLRKVQPKQAEPTSV